MARRYPTIHLFWLEFVLVIVLLAAVLATALAVARLQGWHWQNPGWNDGPTLGRLIWQDGDCTRLSARDIRLSDIWPLQIAIDHMTVRSCADDTQPGGSGELQIPTMPPFDVVVQQLQFQHYPAARVALHHRGADWRAQLSLKDGRLQATYDTESNAWALGGQVDIARLSDYFGGTLDVRGNGYWRPDAAPTQLRFEGQLKMIGHQIGRQKQEGLQEQGPVGDVTATLSWQGINWTVDAALVQPLALGHGWIVQPTDDVRMSGTGLETGRASVALQARQQLAGEVMAVDLKATVTAAHAAAGWHGHMQAQSRLPQAQQGGKLALNAQWQWQNGLVLLPGAQLDMTRALYNDVLIKPVKLAATTQIAVGAAGVQGRLHVAAAGVTAARWMLPPLEADLEFDGWQVAADLRIPQWDSTLSLTGRDLVDAPNGTFSARLPLRPAMSRGLGVVARDGVLLADGHWRGAEQPAVTARLQARNVDLDWGSIAVNGLQADLKMSWQPTNVHVRSRVPITVASLDVGVPVTDISLSLDGDLQRWRLRDVSASVLGGHVGARSLTWPATDYQTVTVEGIDVARLAALQSKPVVTLSGRIGGTIPVKFMRHGLAIRNGRLSNETPIWLTIQNTAGVQTLMQLNQTVAVALDALSPLRIEDLAAQVNMDADGWLTAAMTIKGVNPTQRLPIVLNYTHQENMYELLRSLRIGGRIVNAIIGNGATTAPAPNK